MMRSEKEDRALVRHFLGALAYRTQKAVRDAPAGFGDFEAGNQVRTPKDLVRHMTSVLGYARTTFRGGEYRPDALPDLSAELERYHKVLGDLSVHLKAGDRCAISLEQLLQGPLSDAMTHAGQLAMLRRLHGSPVAPEDFIYAEVSADNLGPAQPPPRAPEAEWPEPPGGKRS